MKMWKQWTLIATVSQIVFLIAAPPSPKTINLPHGSPDGLYLGCYEEQSNDQNIHPINQNASSTDQCIQACAHETYPLAAVFNDTKCQCANSTVSILIKNDPCDVSKAVRILLMYNATDFFVEFVEIYQKLTFVFNSSKVTQTSSVTSVTPSSVTPSSMTSVTSSSVTVNGSSSTLYSMDFGDGTRKTSLIDKSVYMHQYVTNGAFNVTIAASRDNSTVVLSSQTIRVLSRMQINGMSCYVVIPDRWTSCYFYDFFGSGISASVTMNSSGQAKSVSLSVPDVPRTVLGNTNSPIANQSNVNSTAPGTYLLPSLQFTKETVVEAWEVYAEHPGRIQLQIFRAAVNLTGCATNWHKKASCGKWVPEAGNHCDKVCVQLDHNHPNLSCVRPVSNHTTVFHMDVNLTVGYNLIVIPEHRRFEAHVGDIGGFHRNTTGAVVQPIAIAETPGAYFVPEQHTSEFSVELRSAKTQNTSFSMKVLGTVKVTAKVVVYCLEKVGVYPLTAVFINAIHAEKKNASLKLRSSIVVQNPVSGISYNKTHYFSVNTTNKITVGVRGGTNITCKWNNPNTSTSVEQSAYLELGNKTEGGSCAFNFTSKVTSYYPFSLTISNRYSRYQLNMHVYTRIIIQGIQVHMCYSAFAFDNASTCFNASITQGSNVGCSWYFAHNSYDEAKIEKSIAHRFTPAGNKTFTVYCHNFVSGIPRVNYTVRVITNPLTIEAPIMALANTQVKFTCALNWPGGSPAAFFANQSVAGLRGSNIVVSPILTIKYKGFKMDLNASFPAAYLSFKRQRHNLKHEVLCQAKNYPDLNTFHVIKIIYPITEINVTHACSSRVEVGTSCSFRARLVQGDLPSYLWTVSEGGRSVTYGGKSINHRFTTPGLANVTVNVTNGYSSLVNTTQILVLSLSTSSIGVKPLSPLPHTVVASPSGFIASASNSMDISGSMSISNVSSLSPNASISGVTGNSLPLNSRNTGAITAHLIIPSTKTQFTLSSSSVIPHVPSLAAAKLSHVSSGLVGKPIVITVVDVLNVHLLRFLWNWDDETAQEQAGYSSTHTYTQPGQYSVSVHISSSSSQVTLRGHVTIQYPIAGLQLNDVAVGPLNVLRVKFEASQGTNVTYLVDYGDDSGEDLGFIQSFPRVVTSTHQFEEPGRYILSIQASSLVGPSTSVQRSVIIDDTSPCDIHEVRMLGAGEDSKDCPEIQQEYEYSIFTSLKIECSGYEELNYLWKLEKIVNGANQVIALSEDARSSSVFYIAASSLRGSLYKFTITVTAIPQGVSKSATGYLRLRMPRLLAVIECGSERTVSWGQETVVDASESRDPNDVDNSEGNDSLTFQWFCNEQRDVSCFKGQINNSEPVLRFPPQFLEVNKSYPFVVAVSEGLRHVEARQTITVVQGSLPPLCVRCMENCAHKLTTSKEFVLTGGGCHHNKNTSCTWELYGPPSHQISRRSVSSESVLISASSSAEFVLNPSNLIPNKTYTIAFNDGLGFSAKYSVTTDMSPSGGSCVVSPSEGKVIETRFRVNCSGWMDEDSPLWYEFFLSGSMLLSYSWLPYSQELFLPSGSPQNDFTLDLFAKVSDVLGSYRIFPLQVKVRPFSPEEGSVGSILKGVVSGPDAMLEELLAAGEFQQATQLMTTVITVLNGDPHQSTEPGTPDFEDRVEVRTRVIQGFSQMDCGSPQCIRQTLGGLLQATKITAELSPDALVNGATVYTNMAKALVTKYKNQRARSETEGILHGLTDVVEASLSISEAVKREQQSGEIKDWINNANEARDQQTLGKCEKANKKSLEGVDYAAQKILDYQRKGEAPSLVDTSLMRQTLSRQSPENLNAAALNGREVSFQVPLEVKRDKLGHLQTVDSKVITTTQSLFNPVNAVSIDTPVSSLQFQETSGKEVPIRDLTEPISILLSLNQSETKALNNITGAVTKEQNMTVFRIEPGEESSLYFTVRCFGEIKLKENLVLLGRRNVAPTEEEFDFRWNLSTCNNSLTKLLSRNYANYSDGLYLGLKLLTASNVTNTSKTSELIKYEVSVQAIGCYFWDQKIEEWRTEGCEVGPLTTSSRIHCLCNHLTWFGSRVFVPPNTLHFDIIARRILDPSTYAPVLAVLCTTFGIYLIIIVWARREDRKDKFKTGTSLSPSNRPEDTHGYEVIVCTGMRRHAGTTANVAIAITGEHGESNAFLLKNYYRTTLARGSVDSFLVTTSETLGQLSYIRVWHDNYGSDPAWYVKQVSIREVDTDQVWHFLSERWLAVDEGDGMVDRIFPVTSNEELKEFRHLFVTKAYKDLTDSHLWFSVVWRPPQSPFTRVQRVSCCLSLLLCTMMANAMWYEADKGRYTAVELGPLQFSWEQVTIGICSSLVVFPINLLLVQIFRHCRAAPNHNSCCFSSKTRPRFSSNGSEQDKLNLNSREDSASGDSSPSRFHRGKASLEGSPKSTGTSRCSMRSAMRSIHLPSLTVSIATNNSNSSTNDLRSLLQGQLRARSLSRDIDADKLNVGAASNKKGLPWWFLYIGWILVTMTSLTAASVTLLYGIEFGRTKSAQWLLSMFFSITQDIFVSQPLKVVFIAVFFAYILKKPDTMISSKSTRFRFDEQCHFQNLEDNNLQEREVAPPVEAPSQDTLLRARDRAEKEKAMYIILLDIGTFLVFIFLVLLIAYGYRDPDAFYQNDAVAKVLLNQNFSGLPKGSKPDRYSEIFRKRDMWDWIENVLLPSLYNLPSYFYTGKAPRFMEGDSGLVIGVARLRQHRARTDSCDVVDQAKDVIPRCVGDYSFSYEDTHGYTAGWTAVNSSTTAESASPPGPWRYSSSSELDGYPYTGGITTYSGGGYVLELSHIYYKAVQQVSDARAQLWTDHYTRSVFIEFTLYNPNSNLFCAVTLVMEALATGGVFPHSEFLSYRLHRYVGDFQLFVLACEVFFLAFVLYFTYREVKKVFKTRRKYFVDVWNLLDLTALILCWVAVAYFFICFGLRKWTLHQYQTDPTKFTSFQYLSAWQLMFEGVLGVMVFVTCLKFIKLFRFNRRIFLLSYTLRQACNELFQYLLVFGVNFLAFSQLYYFLLASEYRYFSTLFGSMQKLLSVLLGKFSFEEMMSADTVLGAIIFFLYMTITNFIFLNVLIVIIIDSFKVAKRENDQMQNEFEILEFIMERFKDCLGVRSLRKPADPLLAYTNETVPKYKFRSRTRIRDCAQENKYETAESLERETAESLERGLDRLERYIDEMFEREAEDDMLCCYVSRRINPRSPKETQPADHSL